MFRFRIILYVIMHFNIMYLFFTQNKIIKIKINIAFHLLMGQNWLRLFTTEDNHFQLIYQVKYLAMLIKLAITQRINWRSKYFPINIYQYHQQISITNNTSSETFCDTKQNTHTKNPTPTASYSHDIIQKREKEI